MRLKNIADKSEEQLKAIKNETKNIKEVTHFLEEPLSQEAKALINEIRSIKKCWLEKIKGYGWQ